MKITLLNRTISKSDELRYLSVPKTLTDTGVLSRGVLYRVEITPMSEVVPNMTTSEPAVSPVES